MWGPLNPGPGRVCGEGPRSRLQQAPVSLEIINEWACCHLAGSHSLGEAGEGSLGVALRKQRLRTTSALGFLQRTQGALSVASFRKLGERQLTEMLTETPLWGEARPRAGVREGGARPLLRTHCLGHALPGVSASRLCPGWGGRLQGTDSAAPHTHLTEDHAV